MLMAPHRNHGVGPRCATWLREVYPANRGKLIARDFGVSESTVWRWLAGEAPTVRVLEEMAARWGRPFLGYVFDDPGGSSGENLERLIAIREELDRREKEAARVRPEQPAMEKKQYSRAVPREPGVPQIDWDEAGAVRRATDGDLRRLTTHFIEQSLAAAPKPGRLETVLIALRALLRRG